ncbi:hypothetical protein I656_00885 [Geobacillus sp. WSUCF1]|nr:hypothetical protein I656_00885 [Geobacillus sp. WSUCF1]
MSARHLSPNGKSEWDTGRFGATERLVFFFP